MAGPITDFLTADHRRLEALLDAALASPGELLREPYDAFRAGLLRHIALEEKILLPAVREARGEPLPEARRLRVDHGAIAALLVPTPTPGIAAEIRKILDPHDLVEEGEGGVYSACDALLGPRAESLVDRMRAYPAVKVARYMDGPRVCRTAEEALRVSALQSEQRR